MRNFVKIFLLAILSTLLLSSCFDKTGENVENVTSGENANIEFPGENANFVFKVDLKNAEFLSTQFEDYISSDIVKLSDEEKEEYQKTKEMVSKFKDSSIQIVGLSDFTTGLSGVSDYKEPIGMLFLNLDESVVKFMEDFKLGFNNEVQEDVESFNELFNSDVTFEELLQSGKKVGESFKNETSKIEDIATLTQITKTINSITFLNKDVSILVPAYTGSSELTGKLEDNKGFNELKVNLKGNELFYIYGADQIGSEITNSISNEIDVEVASILGGISIEKLGADMSIYIKTKSDITEEQNTELEDQAKEMEEQLKNLLSMASGSLTNSTDSQDLIDIITNLNDNLSVKYTKIDNNIFSISIVLNVDLEETINKIEKIIEDIQSQYEELQNMTGSLDENYNEDMSGIIDENYINDVIDDSENIEMNNSVLTSTGEIIN